jgi:hypothetical protein
MHHAGNSPGIVDGSAAVRRVGSPSTSFGTAGEHEILGTCHDGVGRRVELVTPDPQNRSSATPLARTS